MSSASALILGPRSFACPENAQVKIEAQADFTVFEVDQETEEKLGIICNSHDRQCRFTARTPLSFLVDIDESYYWGIDMYDVKSPFESSDPTSAVVHDIPPETLEMKIKRMLAAAALERFGHDQVETIEEALNFDIDGDDEVGISGYEVQDVVPEYPATGGPSPGDIAVPREPTADAVSDNDPATETSPGDAIDPPA